MNKKITTLTAFAAISGGVLFGNTPLIENTDFSAGYKDEWIFGYNSTASGAYVGFLLAPTDFEYETVLSTSGSGVTLTSFDDQTSDNMDLNVFVEDNAASPIGDPAFLNTTFEEGDVIVFKGSASATKSAASVTVRAFIKTLGYGAFAFDVLNEYTEYQPLTPTLTPFELSITYPNEAAAEPFQVIQYGFQIITDFENGAMQTGEIYFENIEAYIEGGEAATWAGYTLDENGIADTGDWMGMVNATNDPWIYSYDLSAYIYIPVAGTSAAGAWVYATAP